MMKLKSKIKIKPGMKLFLVTVPFLCLYGLFRYFPMFGWSYAFYDYKPGLELTDCEFVGFKYFTRLFMNPVQRRETLRVLRNTLGMSSIGMLATFVPVMFAVLLNELKGKYKRIVQTITTVPHFISWVLVYALAFAMFASDSGLVNILLRDFGLVETGINFLASSEHVWLTMYLYSMWKGTGWNAIVYLAAISSIDQELYDAAAVDGAGRFQKMLHITIPGILPTFVVLLIMSIGNFLDSGIGQSLVFSNAFNKEWIETLDLYVYNQGINGGKVSQSTAIGISKSLIGLVLLWVANTISGKVREEKVF